jgi:hypothetical protein
MVTETRGGAGSKGVRSGSEPFGSVRTFESGRTAFYEAGAP